MLWQIKPRVRVIDLRALTPCCNQPPRSWDAVFRGSFCSHFCGIQYTKIKRERQAYFLYICSNTNKHKSLLLSRNCPTEVRRARFRWCFESHRADLARQKMLYHPLVTFCESWYRCRRRTSATDYIITRDVQLRRIRVWWYWIYTKDMTIVHVIGGGRYSNARASAFLVGPSLPWQNDIRQQIGNQKWITVEKFVRLRQSEHILSYFWIICVRPQCAAPNHPI